METKDKVNIHAGHRERMRDNIKKYGIFNMSDIHFLEYLLTFVIKRSDTNPRAHALLKEFGSIPNIFNASTFALSQVKGVGAHTAEFLKYMSLVVHKYKKSQALQTQKLDTLKSMVNFVKNILQSSDCEQFVIVVLNKNYTLKDYKIFEGVSHSFISINNTQLSEFLINHKASFLFFAHTHPYHSSTPSTSDINAFNTIQPLLDSLSIVLVENIIIGDTNFYSLKNARIYDLPNEE